VLACRRRKGEPKGFAWHHYRDLIIATHRQLAAPVIALSLAVLRARVGRQLDIAAVNVRLKLDRAARDQRDARRRGGAERASDTSGQNAAG